MPALNVYDRFLRNRKGTWQYYRRVPKCYEDIDDRGTIRLSLKTDSLTLARSKRDALAQADEQLWLTLSAGKGSITSLLDPKTGKALKRYEAARHRAMSRGFVYAPADEVARHPEKEKTEARALLGGVTRPKIPVSKAFEIFCEKIAVSQVIGKSDAQKRAWKKAKKRAVTNFIKTCGDLPMDEITRQHGQKNGCWRADWITDYVAC